MLLKLSQGTDHNLLLVNTDQIRCIYRSGTGSAVTFGPDDYWYVNESPTEIQELLGGNSEVEGL